MKEIKNVGNHSVLEKASKAIVDDYYKMQSYPKGAVPPDVNYSKLLRYVIEDEEVRGFLGSISDAVVASGYKLLGTKSAVAKAEKKITDIKFNKHLKKMYHYCLGFEHTFIEYIKNKQKSDVVDLMIWSPEKIKPDETKHGDLVGYVLDENTAEVTKWDLDEMSHITVDQITDGFWTYPKLKTMERLIDLKTYIMNHLIWAYSTNQFRTHFHATGLGEDDIEWFTLMLKEGMVQQDKFLVTVGADQMEGKQIMTPADLEHHISMLNKIRNQMLTLLRVPPIIAGTVDNSNRSNSEIQARFSFTTRIRSFQKDIEDEIENQIFPRLGIKNVKFKHNIVDIKNDKELVEIASSLINMGASKEKTTHWLNERGLDIPDDIFELTEKEKKEKQESTEQFGEGRQFPPNSNQYESRKPQDNFGESGNGVGE